MCTPCVYCVGTTVRVCRIMKNVTVCTVCVCVCVCVPRVRTACVYFVCVRRVYGMCVPPVCTACVCTTCVCTACVCTVCVPRVCTVCTRRATACGSRSTASWSWRTVTWSAHRLRPATACCSTHASSCHTVSLRRLVIRWIYLIAINRGWPTVD